MQNFYWYSGYVAKPNNYYPQPLLSPQDIPQVVAPSTMMAPGKNDMEKLKEKFKRLERENIQLKRELAMLQVYDIIFRSKKRKRILKEKFLEDLKIY